MYNRIYFVILNKRDPSSFHTRYYYSIIYHSPRRVTSHRPPRCLPRRPSPGHVAARHVPHVHPRQVTSQGPTPRYVGTYIKIVFARVGRRPCGNFEPSAKLWNTFPFESYGFIHVHIVIIMMRRIVLNDSIGGHIHIIHGKFTKSFCFLYRHHFLAIVICNLVLSYG
jgi:hypothetical protein